MLPAAGSLACGAVALAPLSLLVDAPWTLSPSGRSIVALLCLAALSTALAMTLYFRLLRTLGAVGATSQAYLRVPVGVAIGVAFLGEALSPTALAGSILVFTGVAAITLGERAGHAHWPKQAGRRTRLSARGGWATASRPGRDSGGTGRRTGR